MINQLSIERASKPDLAAIVDVLRANRSDPGLFQQSVVEVESRIAEFVVARAPNGQIVGCAALHPHTSTLAEVLGVAVYPHFQGHGIGSRLVEACEQRAKEQGFMGDCKNRLTAFSVAPLYERKTPVADRRYNICCQPIFAETLRQVWLATTKPDYFSRFGYRKISRWQLPAIVLLRKLLLVFRQPVKRWLPILVGRHTFMIRDL